MFPHPEDVRVSDIGQSRIQGYIENIPAFFLAPPSGVFFATFRYVADEFGINASLRDFMHAIEEPQSQQT